MDGEVPRTGGAAPVHRPRCRPLRPAPRHPPADEGHRGRVDEGAERWHVRTDRGDRVTAQFLIMATGCLSVPRLPDVARTRPVPRPVAPHGAVAGGGRRPRGKRVAVIGTAPRASSHPAHRRAGRASDGVPADAQLRDPGEQPPAQARGPAGGEGRATRRCARRTASPVSASPSPRPTKGAMEVPAEEREAYYRKVWYDDDNSLVSLLSGYNDLIISKESNDTIAQFVRDRIAEVVDDPEVAKELQPGTTRWGAKRPCLGTNYYETFNRPEREPGQRALAHRWWSSRPAASARRRSEHPVRRHRAREGASTRSPGALTAVDIRGRGGPGLAEKWAGGAALPTWGSPLARIPEPVHDHRSGQPVGAVQHDGVDRAARGVGRRLRSPRCGPGASGADGAPTDEAGGRLDAARRRGRADDALPDGRTSWYVGSNVPGKPRVFMPYAGGRRGVPPAVRPHRRLRLRGIRVHRVGGHGSRVR